MKTLYIAFIVLITSTSCGLRGYDNYSKIDSQKNIIGKYMIIDSSAYANPFFMLSLKDTSDRCSSYGASIYIDSIDYKFIHGRFEKNDEIESFSVKRGLSKKYLTLKRKHHFKIFVILNIYGTSKSKLRISEDGNLLLTKSNYGCAFLIIAPAFSASEEFDFVYKKE